MVVWLRKNVDLYLKNNRSMRKITKSHLKKLCEIVFEDKNDFFGNNPRYSFFKDRLYAILLVQGAAAHYVDGKTGINDFDLLVLFRSDENHKERLYRRAVKRHDFDVEDFREDVPGFPIKESYRKVDVIYRQIDPNIIDENNLELSIKNYFSKGKTNSIKKYWAPRPVVGIYPENILGTIVWSGGQKTR